MPQPASTPLEHKGYRGSVQYSAEDRLFHGSLLNLRDVITYEGANLQALQQNFTAAVNEYLAFCAAENKSPDPPAS